jgi:hypothetical protein
VAARALWLSFCADLLQGLRGTRHAGAIRLAGIVLGGGALVAVEVWLALALAERITALPPPLDVLAGSALIQLATLMTQLAVVMAIASALTLALPVLEELEGDPWWSACPRPPMARALQTWWRVLPGLLWLVVLVAPPLMAWAWWLRPGPAALAEVVVGLALLMAFACALGCAAALTLSALISRTVLVPLAWAGSTAAMVGAIIWLRSLNPEAIFTATDPSAVLAAVASLGSSAGGQLPGGWLTSVFSDGARLGMLAAITVVAALAMLVVWHGLSRRAAVRLGTASQGIHRPARIWLWIESIGGRRPGWILLCSRLRLLVRDTVQASQSIYLLGLGAVYVENLRSLPLDDPLAREIAGLVNLAMAGFLCVALSLRFAYTARLMDGAARWWWETAPLARGRVTAALAGAAALPPVALAGGLFVASIVVAGTSHAAAHGWWLIPWEAVWLTLLGLVIGPRPAPGSDRTWLDAALGGGGIAFLAVGTLSMGWVTWAAGRWVVQTVLSELGLTLDLPGLWLHPAVPASVLSAGLLLLALIRTRTSQHP